MDSQDNQLQARPELSQVKQEICRRIAEGETVRQMDRLPEFPSRETILKWRNSDPIFDLAMTRAYQAAGTFHADRVQELADDMSQSHDKDASMCARVAMDGYKWLACKFYPKMFGEQSPRNLHQTLVTGDVTLVADEGQRQAMIQARDKFLTGKPVKLLDEGKPGP